MKIAVISGHRRHFVISARSSVATSVQSCSCSLSLIGVVAFGTFYGFPGAIDPNRAGKWIDGIDEFNHNLWKPAKTRHLYCKIDAFFY